METIVSAVLEFIGQSAVGGLTWDIIKKAGGKIVLKFKKYFTEKKYFENEKQAEEFLQDIFTKEPYNKRFPLEDMWAIYDNHTHQLASEVFKNEMVDWLKSCKELLDLPKLSANISIEKQVNMDSAKVTNIGIQYNYGSERHGDN